MPWSRTSPIDQKMFFLTDCVRELNPIAESCRRYGINGNRVMKNPGIAPAVARLKTLRGVRTLTAMTIRSELIDLSRFASPRDLMSFIGLVPSEYSSGGKQRRGSLTRAGNAHLRRVLVEAA